MYEESRLWPPIRFDYIFTDHATIEMGRRRLQEKDVDAVLRNPGQRFDVRPGRVILQSRHLEGSAEYLLRVFVDVDRTPAEVVTAYRTSKIAKYWRDER
jgi:hypothetical protein